MDGQKYMNARKEDGPKSESGLSKVDGPLKAIRAPGPLIGIPTGP